MYVVCYIISFNDYTLQSHIFIIHTEIEICTFKRKSIQENYADLTEALPIDNLLSVLYSKSVITIREKKQIEKGELRENKVSYLFDDIIVPALKVGHGVKFDMLIKEMLSSKDSTANHLANKLMRGNV